MGWAANVFLLIGMYLVGEKRRSAFLFTIVGELLYVWRGLDTGQTDLAVICLLFGAGAAWNWRKWGRVDGKA
jgi:hypothetical protein